MSVEGVVRPCAHCGDDITGQGYVSVCHGCRREFCSGICSLEFHAALDVYPDSCFAGGEVIGEDDEIEPGPWWR